MIDESDIRFDEAVCLVLRCFEKTRPLTPCEVYDDQSENIDLDHMGLKAMPVSIYMSIYIFSQDFLERVGKGYKLTYQGWQEIRRIEKRIKGMRVVQVAHHSV